MDISLVHRVVGVLVLIFANGIVVLFLFVYLSDFDPVELAWSKMKLVLCKLKVRTSGVLEKVLIIALASITKEDITNYFSHDGYL